MNLLRRALLVSGLAALSLGSARAQLVGIGYNSDGGFVISSYSGTGSFVDTAQSPITTYYNGSTPASGEGGNAIIVTPIVDPVVHFNSLSLYNDSPLALISVTMRLPQYPVGDPRRTQLGFVNTGVLAGTGSNAAAFNVTFSDPVGGNYDGDYAGFAGQPVYSTIHFYQGAGAALIANGSTGQLNFFAAYPAAQQGTSFFMDVVASSTNGASTPNATQFNTPGNPAGGIFAAPEPGTLALLGLGGIGALGLRRRKR